MDYDVDAERLLECIGESKRVLQVFRENRNYAMKQFVGANYSDNGSDHERPLNMIALYHSIVSRNLIAKNPRCMVSSPDHTREAAIGQAHINKNIKRLKADETLRGIVGNALYCLGIGRVALTTPAEAELGGYAKIAGQVCFDQVDLDDFFVDHQTRLLTDAAYVGHEVCLPIDAVKDSKVYDSPRKELEPDDETMYNEQGDEHSSQIWKGSTSRSGYYDYVRIMEVYMPRTKQIVTLHKNLNKPLKITPWVGPPCGPYHFLGFAKVGNNPIPKAPIMDLIGLDDMLNEVIRKLGRQAQRQKTNLFYSGSATDDAKRISESSDGEPIRVDNVDKIREVSHGGPSNMNMGFAPWLKELFTYGAGNLDMIGGLAAQSGTLGQDQMLEKNSSRVIADMQEIAIVFAQQIMEALCWFWWHNPFDAMTQELQAPNGIPLITRKLSVEERAKVPFEEMNFEVDPYSMRHDTPESRLAALNQVVMNVLMPMMPILQQQGIVFDVMAYLKEISRYLNMINLESLVSIVGPQTAGVQQEGGAPEQMQKPQNTTRRYVRENRSAGKDNLADKFMKEAMGGPSQNGDGAAA